jgi:hypothetical protein
MPSIATGDISRCSSSVVRSAAECLPQTASTPPLPLRCRSGRRHSQPHTGRSCTLHRQDTTLIAASRERAIFMVKIRNVKLASIFPDGG